MVSLIFLGACNIIYSQSAVSGIIYSDDNGNGVRDTEEKGIPRVSVTDGVHVVQTDRKGHYELPVSEDMIIAVIKPSGFSLPVNANNLPQFYYIHKPMGSPTLKFEGVKPTGSLPESVDFGLKPAEEKDEFTTLIFGDPQPYTREELAYFEAGVVAEVEGIQDVIFGLSLGDLVGNDLELFEPYIGVMKKAGIPWFNLMGNHDMNFDAETDNLSDETYESHFGPANYAYNYGKVHFIVLDDILYPDPRDQKGYWGGFRPDQLQFIEEDLKYVSKDHLIVLAFHIPLSEPEGDSFRDKDREKLFRLLKDFPHTLSLSAHTHIQRQDYMDASSGWLRKEPHHHFNVGTTSGDWYSGLLNDQGIPVSTMRDGTPKGYVFMKFRGNQYEFDYKVAGEPEAYQIKVFAPKVIEQGRRSKSGLYANFFVGREGDKVSYRVDGGNWQDMDYVVAPDPSFVATNLERDTSEILLPGRRASDAIDCKHLWRGELPFKLSIGTHKIEIRAVDMFGKEHHAVTEYRIAKSKI
ncbi:metallophosphoesterase [Robertkochia solimangrovi]|nr:metallophosphoesterase [Robertkochia solimangrovi]